MDRHRRYSRLLNWVPFLGNRRAAVKLDLKFRWLDCKFRPILALSVNFVRTPGKPRPAFEFANFQYRRANLCRKFHSGYENSGKFLAKFGFRFKIVLRKKPLRLEPREKDRNARRILFRRNSCFNPARCFATVPKNTDLRRRGKKWNGRRLAHGTERAASATA